MEKRVDLGSTSSSLFTAVTQLFRISTTKTNTLQGKSNTVVGMPIAIVMHKSDDQVPGLNHSTRDKHNLVLGNMCGCIQPSRTGSFALKAKQHECIHHEAMSPHKLWSPNKQATAEETISQDCFASTKTCDQCIVTFTCTG